MISPPFSLRYILLIIIFICLVYETCKLGSHTPHAVGNQMDVDSGKCSTSGFVLLDNPRSVKVEGSNASCMGSISDFFLSLSSGWDLASYLRSLAKVLKTLQLGSCLAANTKEGNSSPCTVSYIFSITIFTFFQSFGMMMPSLSYLLLANVFSYFAYFIA